MPSSLSFAQHMPDLLMVAGVLLLTGLMLMNLRRRGSRRNSESARDFIDRVRDDNGIRTMRASEQMAGRTLREYDEFVRDLTQRLDVKTAQLERLLKQAEGRIKMLESVLNEAPGASISPSKVAVVGSDGMLELAPPVDPVMVDVANDADDDDDDAPLEMPSTLQYADAAAANGATAPGGPDPRLASVGYEAAGYDPAAERYVSEDDGGYALTPEIVVPSAPLTLDPLSASVYELADRGRSPVEIAQQLDEQVGKVELILALRQAS